jgi:exopolysaccharide biosynthesis WecB/TagA/CpsF family protein
MPNSGETRGLPGSVPADTPPGSTVRPRPRVTLFGLTIDPLTMDQTIAEIDRLIAAGGVHQHVVVNVAKVVQAERDPSFRDIVNACDLISADGQPIVWVSRLLGRPLPQRVTGIDLMVRLFRRAEEAGHSVYLLGATERAVKAVVERLEREHPRLRIAGWHDGYWSPESEESVVEAVAAAKPTIVFLAIPSPQKERFLARWKERLGAPFIMGVGGSFDVYAGLVRRAPKWMQGASLEWLFRLLQEPRRMSVRYLRDGWRFGWLLIRAPFGRKRRPTMPAMRIAIMGTRGVPAAYGGFETFAEELGARLADRGHRVTVYGRSHVVPPNTRVHRGMRVRILPAIRHKYLDTVSHTALSVADGLLRRFDIVLMCNSANAPFAMVPMVGRSKVALNVDGLEWRRGKWSRLGRWYYQACSWLAPKLPIVLVSDARVIAEYYGRRFGKPTVYIPYGSDAVQLPAGPTLATLGIEPRRYLLYVSRFEPENNAHTVLEGYRRAGGLAALKVPLVLVGDAPYASRYKAALEAAASKVPGVIMPGYVFGPGYAELQSNALLYIQATEVGGTHPALVEAMGRGAAIVANDVPEHREVLGDSGHYYARNDPQALAERLRWLVADADERTRIGAAAAARACATFSWDHVTDEYERLFSRMTGRESPQDPSTIASMTAETAVR